MLLRHDGAIEKKKPVIRPDGEHIGKSRATAAFKAMEQTVPNCETLQLVVASRLVDFWSGGVGWLGFGREVTPTHSTHESRVEENQIFLLH
jgi:hypothetical protein